MNSPGEAFFAVPSKPSGRVGAGYCVEAPCTSPLGAAQAGLSSEPTEGSPPAALWSTFSSSRLSALFIGLSKRAKLTFKSWMHSPVRLLTEQLQCYLTLASCRFSGSSETHCPQAELPQILHPQIWISWATFSDSQANTAPLLYSILYMLGSWPIFSALFPNHLCKQCQNLVLRTNNIFWK